MKSVAWLLPAASSRYGQWNVEQLLSPLTSASTNIFISDLFQISVTGGNHITRLRDSNRHQAVWCQDNATPPAQPELERSSQSPFYNLKLCLRSIKCCKGSHTCSQSQYQPTQFTNQIWCGLLTTAVLPCLLPTPPTDIQSDEPHWQHFCENIKRYSKKYFSVQQQQRGQRHGQRSRCPSFQSSWGMTDLVLRCPAQPQFVGLPWKVSGFISS